MNKKALLVPVAIGLLALSACAHTAKTPENASAPTNADLGPPVVDISKPAPKPGVATKTSPDAP